MKIFGKVKSVFAFIMALVLTLSVAVYEDINVVSAANTYYVAVYTTTTPFYTSGANVNQETQSVYFAVSEDGENYTVLNSNGGVIFAKSGDFRVTNPLIFHQDGEFTVVAADTTASRGYHVFTSQDGVHYYDDTLKPAASVGFDLSTPKLQKADVKLMYKGEDILEKDSSITLGNAVEINEQQYQYYLDKLSKVTNTGLRAVKSYTTTAGTPITQDKLETEIPTVKANYSDGSSKDFAVDWTGALDNVDFSKAGNYTIEGKVVQTKYINKLKELNGSNLPDDDPDNANKDFPSNYDPNTGTVYYDETKFVEGLADPQIFWDEKSGYYYMTGSYFPQASDAMAGETTQQYDRVTLRRGRTLEELQNRSQQVTVWKAGNQNWYNGEADTVGSTGHRYIWAPEIHRVGNYWVVYFTESHSSSEVYNIYAHALVLDGNKDPYETALTNKDGVSEWKDYKMQVASGLTPKYGSNFSLNTSFCLDMTYFKDEQTGQSYVVWAGKPTAAIGGSSTDLFIAPINDDKPWEITATETRLSYSEYGWERIRYMVNEGATILQKDGKIYLSFAVSGTGSEYAIGLLTADIGADLMDPASWTKNPYPLLSSRDVDGEEGPGHNSFTVDKDGNDIFVYHARPTSHNYQKCGDYNGEALRDPCRHARIKRVHWSADGTPILAMTYDEELSPENQTVRTRITVRAKTVLPTIAPTVNATGVSVAPTSRTLNVGKSVSLKATVSPSNATNKSVTWKSSKTSVATVSATGVVKAKAAGTANITVTTANGKRAICKITVKAPVRKLQFKNKKYNVTVGKRLKLKSKLKVTPKKTTDKLTFTLQKGKKKFAKINKKTGVLTAKKAGKVKVTVKSSSGKKVTCTVTIKAKK